MSLTPGSHVGPYEVIAPLGEGAMGVVFRARDMRLQRDVALKLLPDHFRIHNTWLMPVEGEHKASPYLETGFDKFHARVSPNGRWIAYSTYESGTYQIAVQTFPNASGGKWQISAEGGVEPKWQHDGRELYYPGFDGKLMAISISGPDLVAGRPEMLFQTTLTTGRNQQTRDRRYDVSPDGRFLLEVPAATTAPPPITVILNWTAKLER
jgi:serine/threonine-protein kinase